MSTEYCITKNYRLYLKLFKLSLLINTITTLYLAILILIKQKNSLAGNIISQALKKMLRLISKAATFI